MIKMVKKKKSKNPHNVNEPTQAKPFLHHPRADGASKCKTHHSENSVISAEQEVECSTLISPTPLHPPSHTLWRFDSVLGFCSNRKHR